LTGTDWDGTVSFCNVLNGGLGSGGEIKNGLAYCTEGAPCAGVYVGIDGIVDRGKVQGGDVWVREIMYSSEFSRFSGLGNKGEGGRLKGSDKVFNLVTRAWANVTTALEFFANNLIVSC